MRLVLAHEGRDPGSVVAICPRSLSREAPTAVAFPTLERDGTVISWSDVHSFDLLREWVRTLPEDPTSGEDLRRQRAPWSLYDTPAVAVRLWLEKRQENRERDETALRSAEGLPRLYFPVGVLSSNPRADSSQAIWFSRALDEMGEASFPSLRLESPNDRYRFLWLRTYHPPFAFRIELGKRAKLLWKSMNGKGGYNPGEHVEDRTKVLSTAEWDLFTRALVESRFWELHDEESVFGNDGSNWVIEGQHGSRYRVIVRWCGQELEPLGRMFLRLTGEAFEPIY